MFASVTATKFKAFKESVPIPFGRLTVFAGVNSVGKSTALQTLLVLKQSIEAGGSNVGLQLNGDYVQLGTFKDVFSRGASPEEISLALEFMREPAIQSVSFNFQNENGRPNTTSFVCHIPNQEAEEFTKQPLPNAVWLICEDEKFDGALRAISNPNRWLLFKGLMPDRELLLETRDPTKSKTDHLNEVAIVVVQKIFQVLKEAGNVNVTALRKSSEYMEAACESGDWERLFALLGYLLSESAAYEGRVQLGDFLSQDDLSDLRSAMGEPFVAAIDAFLGFEDVDLEVMAQLSQLQNRIKYIPEGGYTLIDSELIKASRRASALISNHVHYLGPLRRPPMLKYQEGDVRPLYRIYPDGRGIIPNLVARWKDKCAFPLPQESGASSGSDDRTVQEVVNAWCKFIGIADRIELPRLDDGGFELRFFGRPGGGEVDYDLPTNVGVGITQLFPIICLLVLMPRDTTCLLEQPELHLHPAMQSRMANLFGDAIRAGLQVIVETHSEHFLTAIRTQVAKGLIPHEEIVVLFRGAGSSSQSFEEISMNSQGDIDRWPEGFFDETERATLELLKASM